MTQRLVHFATNRIWDRGKNEFARVPESPASRLWLGTVWVGVSADPLVAGAVTAPDVSGFDDFRDPVDRDGAAAGVLASWLARAEAREAVPILLVHGFNYTFPEACQRAGNLCDWLEDGTGLKLEPLGFTWPSNGIGNLSAYDNDQEDCAASGKALARLIRQIGLAAEGAPRPPAYLAHSMGTRCTRFAMMALKRDKRPPVAVFGQAVVIGCDDDTDVLNPPDGPLRHLASIAQDATIGIYPQDGTLTRISAPRNKRLRLGATGPDVMPDPEDRIFVVDYTYAVSSKPDIPDGTTFNDVGHQYYRNDPRTRQDLTQVLAGVRPLDVTHRHWGQPDPTIGFKEKAGRLYVDTAFQVAI